MKNKIRITGKVLFILILLFLFCYPKTVKAGIIGDAIESIKKNMSIDIFEDEEKENSAIVKSIEETIDKEGGGLFESTIAKALGGIAKAVFNVSTSDTINVGFRDYDELIFNESIFFTISLTDTSILPFSTESWGLVMDWYHVFSAISFVPILLATIIASYRIIFAGANINKRNEAKDSLMRLLLGALSIILAPSFVKLLLIINSNLVAILTNICSSGLNNLLGNKIFSQIQTGSAIATAIVICLFAYLFIKFNIKFIIRKFTIIVFTVFTPLIVGMWMINKNVSGAAIWFGQIIINVFMQFIYAFLFLIYMSFTSTTDGWASSLLWAMMILPLRRCFNEYNAKFSIKSGRS